MTAQCAWFFYLHATLENLLIYRLLNNCSYMTIFYIIHPKLISHFDLIVIMKCLLLEKVKAGESRTVLSLELSMI